MTPLHRELCLHCGNWTRVPGRNRHIGRCDLDNQISHAGYGCTRFEQRNPTVHRLGLTDDEVAWIRQHRHAPVSKTLIRLYRMVQACPSDPGARGIFAATLANWRRERDRMSRNPSGFASNQAGTDEGTPNERNERDRHTRSRKTAGHDRQDGT